MFFYGNNRKWIDIGKLAAHFVQVTVGRRNVPKGRVWNPMEQSKWTEVSSTVNYTQILFHVGQGSPAKCPAMVGRGSPVGGKLHSNFVGLKFIINCFSLSHIIWWVFLSDWQSQCLEDIMVAQTKMLSVRGRWNDDIKLCTTWSFSAAYMKDCFLWRLFYF